MKTTDIIIPLNAGGSFYDDDFELRYALRSISENLTNYRDIIIVCNRPPRWLRNVKIVKQPDWSNKAITLANKRLAGALNSNADNIMWWSDDFILLKPTNSADIPVLRKGFKSLALYNEDNMWNKILRNTARVLKLHGKTTFNCESHTPCLLNRKKFIELTEIFKKELNTEPGLVTPSLYHNYFLSPMQEMDGYKATFESKTDIPYKTNGIMNGKIFLGYNDCGFTSGVKEFLTEKFINKSKYEV